MLKMQRILSLLLIAVLLMLTACSMPERVSSPSPALTASPTATATPTPVPSPTATPAPSPVQTSFALSDQEVITLLDGFVAGVFNDSGLTAQYDTSYDGDIYTVYLTLGDPTDSLFVLLNDEGADAGMRKEALDSLCDFMPVFDGMSGNLKMLLDRYERTSCRATIFVCVESYPAVPIYTAVNGEKLHSVLDSY